MDLENRTELPNSLEEHWMPFTSNKDFKENPRLMVGAQGVYYTDHHGNKLIDATSGLFCNPVCESSGWLSNCYGSKKWLGTAPTDQ